MDSFNHRFEHVKHSLVGNVMLSHLLHILTEQVLSQQLACLTRIVLVLNLLVLHVDRFTSAIGIRFKALFSSEKGVNVNTDIFYFANSASALSQDFVRFKLLEFGTF